MAQLGAAAHRLASPGSICSPYVIEQDAVLIIYHPRAPTTRDDIGELFRTLKGSYPGVYNTVKATENLLHRQGRGKASNPPNPPGLSLDLRTHVSLAWQNVVAW